MNKTLVESKLQENRYYQIYENTGFYYVYLWEDDNLSETYGFDKLEYAKNLAENFINGTRKVIFG